MNSSVTIYWPALAGALLLLWFPPSLWLSRNVKRYLSRPDACGEFRIRRGIVVWQNWVDLLRGFAGTYLLIKYAIALEVTDGPDGHEWNLFAWRLGILLVALLIQTVRRFRHKTFFLAPVFFLWGVTFVLVGPLLAFYGILVSVVISNVADNLEWNLPIMAIVVGAAGLSLEGFNRLHLIAVIAIVFPLIVTFCGRGRLAFLMPEEKRK